MNVFAYGTLMYQPVWERVVEGVYKGASGTLQGYARRRIAGESHPALVRAPDCAVRGVVYLDVAAPDLAALDRFEDEGDAYLRVRVPVDLDDGRSLEAWTYLYLHPDQTEDSEWDPERFQADDLHRFLETYCRDRAIR